jgi:hypothetical protein
MVGDYPCGDLGVSGMIAAAFQVTRPIFLK